MRRWLVTRLVTLRPSCFCSACVLRHQRWPIQAQDPLGRLASVKSAQRTCSCTCPSTRTCMHAACDRYTLQLAADGKAVRIYPCTLHWSVCSLRACEECDALDRCHLAFAARFTHALAACPPRCRIRATEGVVRERDTEEDRCIKGGWYEELVAQRVEFRRSKNRNEHGTTGGRMHGVRGHHKHDGTRHCQRRGEHWRAHRNRDKLVAADAHKAREQVASK